MAPLEQRFQKFRTSRIAVDHGQRRFHHTGRVRLAEQLHGDGFILEQFGRTSRVAVARAEAVAELAVPLVGARLENGKGLGNVLYHAVACDRVQRMN